MDSEDHVALPKGIVVNTSNIYQEVASFPLVPPDKAWKYWRVYTTTNKKLQDPVARRLENFWWHVLGSDRRLLSGSVLASIYEHISLGPTFVPLRGPPNRWEGPDTSSLSRPETQLTGPNNQGKTPSQDKDSGTPEACSSRNLSIPSASRPPPAHPILKKPRGPSATGPRPTARFVSPHGSDDEDERENCIPSSGSTATPASEMPPSNFSPPKKKAPASSKKVVASTSKGKRRPLIRRKSSSQATGVPRLTSKEAAAIVTSQSPEKLDSPTVPDPPAPSAGASSAANHRLSSLELKRPQHMSEKAAGKRPAIARRVTTDHAVHGRAHPQPHVSKEPPHRDLSSTRQSLVRQSRDVEDNHSPFYKETNAPDSPVPRSPLAPMIRSQSHSGFIRPREGIHIKAPHQRLFTEATSSTTTIAAQGTIIDQAGSVGSVPVSHHYGHRFDEVISPTSSLLDSHLTPTPPSTSASVPLGRTKSQLTLLLEREKARAGNKPRSRS